MPNGVRYCDEHTEQNLILSRKRRTNIRNENQKFYGNIAWIKLSRSFRNTYPICARKGCNDSTQIADHIIPLRYLSSLEAKLAEDNLAPLCRKCHDEMTKLETRIRSANDNPLAIKEAKLRLLKPEWVSIRSDFLQI